MLVTNLIRTKREGGTLTPEQWKFLIDGFVSGQVEESQMAAMAMAICIRGMTPEETAALTRCMLESGECLPRVGDRPRVDKHSTGGLGDKVSLILAPLLACFDVQVPMISGRGLGRTGGTLDKLEAITGFQVHLPDDRVESILRQVGAVIIGADEKIAPADRRLYALRDVTATVESVGLITASILSKKLAASLDALVMDVKVGSGAFMTHHQKAEELAHSLIAVGSAAGLPTRALLTDMDQPLGRAVGNAVEVNESVEVLGGQGPLRVRELTCRLAAEALVQVGLQPGVATAIEQLEQCLDDGRAMECFERMVAAQGGKWVGPLELSPRTQLTAPTDGWVRQVDCPRIADAVIAMGGGRTRAGQAIDHRVGVEVLVEIGDRVSKGDPLMAIYGEKPAEWLEQDLIGLSETPIEPRPVVLQSVEPALGMPRA